MSPPPPLPSATRLDQLLAAPCWAGDVVYDEPVLFLQEDGPGALPRARLLAEPQEILVVRSSDYQREFSPVTAVRTEPGSPWLTLPAGSALPALAVAELYRPPGVPDGIAAAQGPRAARFGAGRWLRYGEGRGAFFDRQVLVTYRRRAPWSGFRPSAAGGKLPRASARVRAGGTLRCALFGDSISEGCSASRLLKAPPYFPPFGELVKLGLKARFGCAVELFNHSKGGEQSLYAREHAAEVAATRPDLVILAFGINDGSHRVPAARYGQNIGAALDEISAAHASAEFLLVATAAANPEWTQAAPDLYPQYREALARLADRPGVALADVTALWEEVVERKSPLDLTVNGVNHPNDFGHRLYAQTILAVLGA